MILRKVKDQPRPAQEELVNDFKRAGTTVSRAAIISSSQTCSTATSSLLLLTDLLHRYTPASSSSQTCFTATLQSPPHRPAPPLHSSLLLLTDLLHRYTPASSSSQTCSTATSSLLLLTDLLHRYLQSPPPHRPAPPLHSSLLLTDLLHRYTPASSSSQTCSTATLQPPPPDLLHRYTPASSSSQTCSTATLQPPPPHRPAPPLHSSLLLTDLLHRYTPASSSQTCSTATLQPPPHRPAPPLHSSLLLTDLLHRYTPASSSSQTCSTATLQSPPPHRPAPPLHSSLLPRPAPPLHSSLLLLTDLLHRYTPASSSQTCSTATLQSPPPHRPAPPLHSRPPPHRPAPPLHSSLLLTDLLHRYTPASSSQTCSTATLQPPPPHRPAPPLHSSLLLLTDLLHRYLQPPPPPPHRPAPPLHSSLLLLLTDLLHRYTPASSSQTRDAPIQLFQFRYTDPDTLALSFCRYPISTDTSDGLPQVSVSVLDMDSLLEVQVDVEQDYSQQLQWVLESPEDRRGYLEQPIETGKVLDRHRKEDEARVLKLVQQFKTGVRTCYFDSESLARYGWRGYKKETKPDFLPLFEPEEVEPKKKRDFSRAARCQWLRPLKTPCVRPRPHTASVSGTFGPDPLLSGILPEKYTSVLGPLQRQTSMLYLLCSPLSHASHGSEPSPSPRRRRRMAHHMGSKVTYKRLPLTPLSVKPLSVKSFSVKPRCVRQLFRNLSPELNTGPAPKVPPPTTPRREGRAAADPTYDVTKRL
ncbi:hypothetical protein WMY93_025493 [Mugilogobius chulae]|uniref:Uncharacterized protein n=1 Tax=Mugilogobius chulae TaxID=88201 RepID=A0AAW0MUU9_9GOBI